MMTTAVRWKMTAKEVEDAPVPPQDGRAYEPFDGYGYGFLAGFVVNGSKVQAVVASGTKFSAVPLEELERCQTSAVVKRGGGI